MKVVAGAAAAGSSNRDTSPCDAPAMLPRCSGAWEREVALVDAATRPTMADSPSCG